VLLRSSVDNRFALVTGVYLVCVVAYVIYQMMGGNPFDSAEEMVRQATIQKLIVMASVVSMFSLSFAFEHQARVQATQSIQ
jgi:hypothetical protein